MRQDATACTAQVQVLIDGGDIPQENRPKITSTVLGQARWNNTLLRCSCCTGRCVRGAQGGWETPTNDAQGVEGSDDGTTVCSTMEGKVESASDALIPAGGAMTSQQEQRADAAPCCQCCERQFALSSPETPCPQTCSVTSWDNLVHDLQLLDRLTSKIRARRDVRVAFKTTRQAAALLVLVDTAGGFFKHVVKETITTAVEFLHLLFGLHSGRGISF